MKSVEISNSPSRYVFLKKLINTYFEIRETGEREDSEKGESKDESEMLKTKLRLVESLKDLSNNTYFIFFFIFFYFANES